MSGDTLNLEDFQTFIYKQNQIKNITKFVDSQNGQSIFEFNGENLKNGQLFLNQNNIKQFERQNIGSSYKIEETLYKIINDKMLSNKTQIFNVLVILH